MRLLELRLQIYPHPASMLTLTKWSLNCSELLRVLPWPLMNWGQSVQLRQNAHLETSMSLAVRLSPESDFDLRPRKQRIRISYESAPSYKFTTNENILPDCKKTTETPLLKASSRVIPRTFCRSVCCSDKIPPWIRRQFCYAVGGVRVGLGSLPRKKLSVRYSCYSLAQRNHS
jgi:hypothetical protein